MNTQWEEINRGRCLTEYKRTDYSEIVKNFGEFAIISQFDPTPKHINDVSVHQLTEDETKLSYGQILYGVHQDGTLEKLRSIIDSSD